MKINVILTFIFLATSLLSCDKSKLSEDTATPKLLASSTATLSIPAPSVYYVNASSGLSLRAGTNLNSKKILTLPYGAQVAYVSAPKHTEMNVAGITGEMKEVRYQGATGFAFDGYLTTLAPPQLDETIEAYLKRISTPQKEYTLSKVAHQKGEAYGMTTSLELPAKSWNEAYKITQRLFQLPKGIQPDFTSKKSSAVIGNGNKRERTKVDELAINIATPGTIDHVLYSYALKGYTRTVTIKKSIDGFTIKEEETSL